MQNKLLKIIACALVGLMISACGVSSSFEYMKHYKIRTDIPPLKDNNNNGIIIYAGSVSMQYYNKHGHIKDITENINIIVNFDNNTLRYSGQVASNSFNINGSFTDKGVIDGSVNFAGNETILRGNIGQNESAGRFTSQKDSIDFGGGFTVYRSE